MPHDDTLWQGYDFYGKTPEKRADMILSCVDAFRRKYELSNDVSLVLRLHESCSDVAFLLRTLLPHETIRTGPAQNRTQVHIQVDKMPSKKEKENGNQEHDRVDV